MITVRDSENENRKKNCYKLCVPFVLVISNINYKFSHTYRTDTAISL